MDATATRIWEERLHYMGRAAAIAFTRRVLAECTPNHAALREMQLAVLRLAGA